MYIPDITSQDSMLWHIVLDQLHFEVLPATMRSPLAAELAGADAPSIAAVPNGPPVSLLVAAANEAFAWLPETAITRLLHELGVGFDPPGDLYSKLWALLRHALPGKADADLFNIMQLRSVEPNLDAYEVLADEALLEAMDDNDNKNEMRNFCKNVEVHLDAKKGFRDRLKQHADKLKPEPAAAKAKAKAKGKAGAKAKAKAAAAPPQDELFTEDSGRRFLPPRAVLYKDFYNKRWLVIDKITGSPRSRSWELHGDTRALCMVLLWAWQQNEKAGGESCPFEFIEQTAHSNR